MRILVIDDDLTFRSIVRSKLAHAGNQVLEAADAASGWACMQNETIDLALIDLGLPDADGRSLIVRARNSPKTRQLPIIVITGREDREAIDEAFEIGANYFLTKPINWALFRHQVTYVVRMADAERQARRAHISSQAESRLKDTIIGRLNYVLRPMAANIAARSDEVAGLLEDVPRGTLLMESVADLQAETRILETTVGDMAHFAALLSDSINLSQASVPLAGLFDGLMSDLKTRVDVSAIRAALPKDQVLLHCDQVQLTRALAGLLDNALRYSPASCAVRLSARQLEDGSDCFTVDDDGPGIAPQKLLRLLAPMVVINESDRAAHDVNGLGLAVAKFVAEAHGGTLTVQSALGCGTTASIHLPSELTAVAHADAA